VNAKFNTKAKDEIVVKTDTSFEDDTPVVTLKLPLGVSHTTLTKSEARAIASALMGAAAEL